MNDQSFAKPQGGPSQHQNKNRVPVTDSKKRRQFAEFFSGIGLMRLGLEKEGWSIAFANDIDDQKLQMYYANFGRSSGELYWVTFTRYPLNPFRPSTSQLLPFLATTYLLQDPETV